MGYLLKILVDADACPVKHIIEKIAKELHIPVIMFCDTSHILESSYSEIITVSKAPDAVDFALFNKTDKGDIVVTQDYGVAAMALGKGAYTIHHNGLVYTDYNIGTMLTQRHIARVNRRTGEKNFRPQRRKSNVEDNDFYKSFQNLCLTALDEIE